MIYVILLIISFVTHWQWTTNLSILTSGDWIFQYPQILKLYLSIPSIWSPVSLGSINIGISFSPFEILYGLLSYFKASYGLSERIVFLWPILILLPVSSYLFLKKNIKSPVAALVGSFVYCYNTYFFELKSSQLTLLVAFALFPLAFLLYQYALNTKKVIYILLTAIVGFIISFYEFRSFYILCFIFLFYFLFHWFFIEKLKNIKSFLKTSFIAALPIVIVFLLNFYWLLGLARTGTLVSNFAFDRSLFGNEFLNILHTFTLHHPFWTGTKTAIFVVQSIPLYFWIIPVVAFIGLYLNIRNKTMLFFGILSLLGIFLTKQVAQPFPDVYPWLFKNFPGFNAFREASKFYVLIAFGYSLLIAGFIDKVWVGLNVTKNQKIIKYSLTILVAGIFLWNLRPIIMGDFGTLVTPRHVPNDYLTVKDFIEKQPGSFRTFWIPSVSRWSMYTNEKAEVSVIDNINGIWALFIEGDAEKNTYSSGQLMVKLLQKPFANKLLAESSIKYVFVPLKDTANDDNFFEYYGENRQYYIDQLNKLSYLKQVNIGTKEIVVYENTSFRPHIYTTIQQETIKSDVPYKRVKYSAINPTQYTIDLKNVKAPLYINFAESYHPDWKLRVGNFQWLDAITQKNYFLADSNHIQNDAFLNSYLINPQKICSIYSCTENEDGSYDMHVTLYFQPQSYVYLGGIVSLATLAGILGYFAVFGIKKIRSHEN